MIYLAWLLVTLAVALLAYLYGMNASSSFHERMGYLQGNTDGYAEGAEMTKAIYLKGWEESNARWTELFARMHADRTSGPLFRSLTSTSTKKDKPS